MFTVNASTRNRSVSLLWSSGLIREFRFYKHFAYGAKSGIRPHQQQSRFLIQPEHQIHVLHCLSGCTFH
jgi:hypothetical protein